MKTAAATLTNRSSKMSMPASMGKKTSKSVIGTKSLKTAAGSHDDSGSSDFAFGVNDDPDNSEIKANDPFAQLNELTVTEQRKLVKEYTDQKYEEIKDKYKSAGDVTSRLTDIMKQ